ncbi:ABC transporter permease [Streptomyces sp. NBC_01476]|uniref:ABC transporter permease n=1 Tax=Streptomyces sp. NBC_01476 TaxID=2903881 RepID=UPI002E37E514|nr:ABC transporter permease [Streptomyces sp. NBC_01476]
MAVVSEQPRASAAEGADVELGRRARRLRIRGGAGVYLGRLGIVVVVLVAWQLASGTLIPKYMISDPGDVVRRLYDLFSSGKVWGDLGITTEELLLGYSIGVVGGLFVGVVLGTWKTAAAVLEPLLAAINSVPKIALAPLFLLWFGIGLGSKVAIAAMTVFFVMFYNAYMGMNTIPRGLLATMQIMGASRYLLIRRLILPQLTVPILAGLKAGVSFAMIGVVVGEFVAANSGLGYYVRNSTDLFDSPGVYAGIVLLMALVMIGVGLVTLLERRLLRWQRS